MRPSSAQPSRDSAEVIRETLRSILASPEFASSERLCRFLKFVVEQSLQGNTDFLKETVIGVEVFDRRPGYDPKLEPIVRIEARRLRTRLDDYYGAGRESEPVRISIPKGGYAPEFEFRDATAVTVRPRPHPLPIDRREELRPWNWRLVAACGATIFLLSAVAWLSLRRPHREQIQPVEVNITSFPGWETRPSFSPDGSQVAFSWDGGPSHVPSIYTIMTTGGPPRQLTSGPLGDHVCAWSPDGNWIALVRNYHDVLLISPLGGPVRKVAEASYASLAWSPDSKSLAIVDRVGSGGSGSIFEVSLAGGQKRRLTSPPNDGSFDIDMAYSPDGRQMAFARCKGGCDLYLLPLSHGSERLLKKVTYRLGGITWTQDGREIIFAAGQVAHLWRLSVSSPGEPAEVPGTEEEALQPAIGRSGLDNSRMRLAYVCEKRDTDIWETPLAVPGNTPKRTAPLRVIASTAVDNSPRFSPDGRHIAFVSKRSGYYELWLCESDGSNPIQLTFFHDGPAGSPRWSPDGTRIVFDYLGKTGRAIYVVNTTGGPPVRWTDWGELGRPSWSHDGRWIYFFWDRSGQRQVWKIPAKDPAGRPSEPVQVTEAGGMEAYESLDGAFLYYNRDHDLWRQPVAGGPPSHVLEHVWHGFWTVTAQGIFFVDLHSGVWSNSHKPVMFFDFKTRLITEVGEIEGEVFSSNPDFCVSPDGTHMLYGILQTSNADIHMLDRFE